MADFLTYKNIEDQIELIVKHVKGSKEVMIQALINMVYFEMLSADSLYPIYWLRDFDDSLAAKAPAVIDDLASPAASAITAANPGVIRARVDSHAVLVADTTSEEFEISGDYTATFLATLTFVVAGSTGNDGTWTIAAAGSTYSAVTGRTTIPVDENVTDATADGTICVHGFVTDDLVSLHSIVGTTELNDRLYRAVAASISTITLKDMSGTAINTTNLTAYASGGEVRHRGVTLATTGKDVGRIITAKWHGYNEAMKAVSPVQSEDLNKWWDDATARPQKYMHRKTYSTAGVETNQLLWFSGSDAAYDLRYWFEKRVSPMSAAGDVPVMPPQFHHGIVAGVVTRLIEYKVQVENAVIWPRLYAGIVEEMKAYNRKFYQDTEDHGPWMP